MKFEPLEGNIRQDSHQRPAAKAVPQAAPGSSNADQLQSTLLRSGTELLQTLDQIPGLNPGVNPSYANFPYMILYSSPSASGLAAGDKCSVRFPEPYVAHILLFQ